MDFNDLKQQSGEEIISDTEGKYLTFFTDQRLFGVPIADVVQIVGMQEITPIPEYPAYAKGVINLRGSIIPVIDMCLRLGKDVGSYTERTCIIVTNINENYVGFIVEAVDAVTDIEQSSITVPPRISNDTVNAYLTGIAQLENRVALLLDPDRILDYDTGIHHEHVIGEC